VVPWRHFEVEKANLNREGAILATCPARPYCVGYADSAREPPKFKDFSLRSHLHCTGARAVQVSRLCGEKNMLARFSDSLLA
jgi:hypothetical protein